MGLAPHSLNVMFNNPQSKESSMKALTTVAIVSTLVFLNGCSGHVYTVLNPNLGGSSDKEKKNIR